MDNQDKAADQPRLFGNASCGKAVGPWARQAGDGDAQAVMPRHYLTPWSGYGDSQYDQDRELAGRIVVQTFGYRVLQ